MRSRKNQIVCLLLSVILLCGAMALFSGCADQRETVLIYTSAEDYRIEYMQQRLNEEFPEYKIFIEYMSTGTQAAKLQAEGLETDCDIVHDLEYGYLEKLADMDLFADLSDYDFEIYAEDAVESNHYIVEYRNGGAIIFNTEILKKKGLEEPTCYEDLLKPEYKGLISMPSPIASGTVYMFLKSLVNEWGEEQAFEYFDKLTPNVLQYTSSGSGPVNALLQGEVAIGLGMTGQAVLQINEGAPLKVVYFDEGSPFTLYGQTIVKGKETRESVRRVFDFIIETYNYENNEKFFPEKIYKDIDYVIENYPQDIAYSNMSGNTVKEKERLLAKWKY